MMPDSVQMFLASLKRSGLMSEAEFSACRSTFESQDLDSAEDAAAKLIAEKKLTEYQVNQILSGNENDCVLVRRYHIQDQIGAGGMGHVFRALDTRLNRIVAIKVMSPHKLSDADAVARFQREAHALAKLQLPNVVQAYDTGEDNGRHFLVMEYVRGVGLAQLLKEKGQIEPTVAVDYIYQVAVGMQRAHEKGLIHRDLKPSNLILTEDGEIKILDLGLARFYQDQISDSQLTRENVGMGTPDYMPPEQFHDARKVDARADIYSLGCTMYHLISGRVPFPGTSLSKKAHDHEKSEPPSLIEFCPEIPAGLVIAFERMTAKRAEARFQSMRETAEELAPYVSGSSPSLPSINHTLTWSRSQASTAVLKRRPTWLLLLSGTVAGITLCAIALFVIPGFWNQPANISKTPVPIVLNPNDQTKKITSREKLPPPHQDVQTEFKNRNAIQLPPNALTVAQDGSAQFKTINAALAKSKPGAYIVVLDAAAYAEIILINEPNQFNGISLEAVNGAVIEWIGSNEHAIAVENVQNVRLKGFRFRSSADTPVKRSKFVYVTGNTSGVEIDELKMETTQNIAGIVAMNCTIKSNQVGLTIRNCEIKTGGYGIVVTGAAGRPSTSISVYDNTIICPTGIVLENYVSWIRVNGNFVRSTLPGGAALSLSELEKEADKLLIANNTIVGGAAAVQITADRMQQEASFHKGQVILRNNIIARANLSDIILLTMAPSGQGLRPKESKFLLGLWTFDHNWRDFGGENIHPILPKADEDHRLNDAYFLSISSTSAKFLHPKKDSPLANRGAGESDPAFPSYVGAIPPEGTPRWSWEGTNQSQSKK